MGKWMSIAGWALFLYTMVNFGSRYGSEWNFGRWWMPQTFTPDGVPLDFEAEMWVLALGSLVFLGVYMVHMRRWCFAYAEDIVKRGGK